MFKGWVKRKEAQIAQCVQERDWLKFFCLLSSLYILRQPYFAAILEDIVGFRVCWFPAALPYRASILFFNGLIPLAYCGYANWLPFLFLIFSVVCYRPYRGRWVSHLLPFVYLLADLAAIIAIYRELPYPLANGLYGNPWKTELGALLLGNLNFMVIHILRFWLFLRDRKKYPARARKRERKQERNLNIPSPEIPSCSELDELRRRF